MSAENKKHTTQVKLNSEPRNKQLGEVLNKARLHPGLVKFTLKGKLFGK